MKGQATKILVGVGSGVSIGLLLLYIGYAVFLREPEPTQHESVSLANIEDCGAKKKWDKDGDGISDNIENNNPKHNFDPHKCTEDRSRAGHNQLVRGINLKDRGVGYLHVSGADKPDTDDWGTLGLINCLEAVGRMAAANQFPVVNTDLSREHGGPFFPHISHKNGLDVDIRYVAANGHKGPLDIVLQPDLYDEVATQMLLQEFVDNTICDPEFILVNLDALQFTEEDLNTKLLVDAPKAHSNNFHVRLKNKDAKTVANTKSIKAILTRLASVGLVFGLDLAEAGQIPAPLKPTIQSPTLRKQATSIPKVSSRRQSNRSRETPASRKRISTVLAKDPIIVRIAPDSGKTSKARKTIQRRLHDSEVPVDLYTLKNPHARIREVEVIPQNQYVAAIETEEGIFDTDGITYKELPHNRLHVLDSNGKTVCYPEHDVRAHAFSPDGAQIAFITGKFYEGGVGFIPTGVFILNINPCEIIDEIRFEKNALPYDLEWVKTDNKNSIYMHVLDHRKQKEKTMQKGPLPVRRYDVKTRRLVKAKSQGIHFFPDGTHCLIKPHEAIQGGLCKAGQDNDSCLRVYKAGEWRALKEFRKYDRGKPVGWSYNKGAQLLFSRPTYESKKVSRASRSRKALRKMGVKKVAKALNTVVNVRTKKTETFEGVVLGLKRRSWDGLPGRNRFFSVPI